MTKRYRTHAAGLPDAPRWLSVILPAAVYPALILSIFVYRPFYDMMMSKEGGIEYLAVVVLAFGIAHGVVLLARYRERLPQGWLVWWYGVATAGMLVFAGEEVSWGQHFGWWTHDQVPEAIRAVNDQNETNFHNMTNVLDQGLTNVIVVGTLVAFALLPVVQQVRRETMGVDNPGYWFWPTRAGLVAAIGVLVIKFPERIYEWTTGESAGHLLRHSEAYEFYIALLMTIYMVSAHRRLRALSRR